MTNQTNHSPSIPVRAADTGNLAYVYLISLVAAVGGLLFGFDTAVIAGAIGFMKEQFQLNDTQTGFVASCVLLGCAVGAAFAGALSDRFGRKKIMVLAACFFAVSAVGAALPRSITGFVIARLIGGLGIGIASMLSPLYIAEVAPARIRGSLVSLNQMAIITGILIAYVVDWVCAKYFGPTTAWRWMFGAGVLPAILFLVFLSWVPESPRWLVKQGQSSIALEILRKVGGSAHAETEMREITETIAHEGASILQLLQPGLRLALLIGVALAILQQITGINTVLYYAPEIFKNAGFATGDALLSSVYVGLINAAFTVAAILLVDKLGRKPLLLIGAAGMGLSIALVGAAFERKMSGGLILAFVLAYVASFALTLGPVVWVVISEIFPTRIRGRAMSIATVLLWVSCYAVSQSFPMLIQRKGYAFTYFLYAVVCFLMIVFVGLVVPETKGKSLEEIERKWKKSSAS
jgi:MFS transporter, SP family, arabinose:H+ symporter